MELKETSVTAFPKIQHEAIQFYTAISSHALINTVIEPSNLYKIESIRLYNDWKKCLVLIRKKI